MSKKILEWDEIPKQTSNSIHITVLIFQIPCIVMATLVKMGRVMIQLPLSFVSVSQGSQELSAIKVLYKTISNIVIFNEIVRM